MTESLLSTAKSAMSAIVEMVADYNNATDDDARESALEVIFNDPLEIKLRGEWTPGETPEPSQAIILLTTGGPAVRLICDLPDGTAELEVQDWGTPWTRYYNASDEEQNALRAYCELLGVSEYAQS